MVHSISPEGNNAGCEKDDHEHNEDTSSGRMKLLSGEIIYKVRIVDLDLKKPKMVYWHELDTRIREHRVLNPRLCFE